MNYLDFDLHIGPRNGAGYPVFVLRSPAGETRGSFHPPFEGAALNELRNALQEAVLPEDSGHPPFLARELRVKQFGQQLFEALFAGEIRSLYDLSLQRAKQQEKGLRLKLHIEAADLAVLPWEYLYDTRQGDFLCLSRFTPVVRYLDIAQPTLPLKVHLPLRVLVLTASPSDQNALDLADEQRRLHVAMRDLEAAGLVQITWLAEHTEAALQRALADGTWHIFHFVGHGGFDEQAGEGVLALENEAGRTHLLTATQLGRLLGDHLSLRLAVLNACEGAWGNTSDLFSSTASTLVRRGIPAVLAMQYAMSDETALTWARTFYQGIAEGWSVDTAAAEARKTISASGEKSLEWGTPVLYLRSPDGRLFDLSQRKRGIAPPVPLASEQTKDYWLKAGAKHAKARQDTEALAAFEHAIQLAPRDAAAYERKGETLARLQRDDEALKAYEQALQLEPSLVSAARGKAEVLKRLGRTQEALTAIRHAGELVIFHNRRRIYRASKLWVRGLTGIASFFEVSILSILVGFSPLPTSSPLVETIKANPFGALLIGAALIALTVLAWLLSRGPEPKLANIQGTWTLSKRLLLANGVSTVSTTLFVGLLVVVLVRPPGCPTALCPAAMVVTNPHGVHDANLEFYFTAFQSTYFEIPGDPTQYTLSNPPEGIGALRLDAQTPPPYRVVLGVHSLQQGRFGILIQQVTLVVVATPALPNPLQVWDAGAPLTYQSDPFQVAYQGEQAGEELTATLNSLPGGHVQLTPGEADTLDIQVSSQRVVDLRFRMQITYRVFNETAFHTLILPNLFEVVFSNVENWHLFQFQGGQLVPSP